MNKDSIEFVIHVKNECDMRIDYEHRDYLIDLIRNNVQALVGQVLPVYGTTKGKTLKEYETTK